MIDLPITHHAQKRIRQRGYQDADINLLLRVAETCGGDAFQLTNQAAQREIKRLKSEIQQIGRLAGSIVVVCGSAVVTVHHGEKSASRRKKEICYEN